VALIPNRSVNDADQLLASGKATDILSNSQGQQWRNHLGGITNMRSDDAVWQ
jgi:hypothetical protein